MPKLTIIVGMAGSGKTVLRKELAQQYGCKGFSDATLTHHDDSKRAGHKCLGEVVARLYRNEDCVIDETHLTHEPFRVEFQRFCRDFLPDVQLHWIFINIDVLACANNLHNDMIMKNRREPSRFEALYHQQRSYVALPDLSTFQSCEVRSPYSPEHRRFEDKGDAVLWLRSMFK